MDSRSDRTCWRSSSRIDRQNLAISRAAVPDDAGIIAKPAAASSRWPGCVAAANLLRSARLHSLNAREDPMTIRKIQVALLCATAVFAFASAQAASTYDGD